MDFSGQNLRGRNFRGQDLTGANFSYADIRGANFSNAILRGANFTGAKAGLQKHWLIFQLIVLLLLTVIFNFFAALSNGMNIALLFMPHFAQSKIFFDAIAPAFITVAVFCAIAFQGLKTKAFRTLAVVAVAVSSVFGGAGFGFGIITIAGVAAGAVAVVAGAGASSGVAVVVGVTVVVIAGVGVSIGVGVVAIVLPGASAAARVGSINTGAGVITGVIAGVIAVAISLLSIYVAWRALKGDKKFAMVWTIGVTFGAIGGTSFRGADLTDANFTKAILESTDFNHTKQKQTILHQVCWAEAKKLDRALLGTSHS